MYNDLHNKIENLLIKFCIGTFALLALMYAAVYIEQKFDQIRLKREWERFGPNVETHLPDMIKAKFPEIEDLEVVQTHNLYEDYTYNVPRYYLRNHFTLTVHVNEQFSEMPIEQKCTLISDIHEGIRSGIKDIQKEYTRFYYEKARQASFNYSDDINASDMTEVNLQVLSSNDRFTAVGNDAYLISINDLNTGLQYEYDYRVKGFRDTETIEKADAAEERSRQEARRREQERQREREQEEERKRKEEQKKAAREYKSSYSSRKSKSSYDSYDAYDDGYEDVWLNDDYDWYRYQYDDDYAQGVDDAMDDEDW